MPRQVSAKQLAIQKSRPYSTAGGGRKKVPCAKCKKRSGALQAAQNIKKLRYEMANRGLMPQDTRTQTIHHDAEHILASMGIGRISQIDVQPNPRSDDRTKVSLKADFSLLKIETDDTLIANSNIIDIKSIILKRGQIKLVRASELIKFPTDFQEPFFKPDDQLLRNSKKFLSKKNPINKRASLVPIVQTMYKQQKTSPVKYRSSHFKIAFNNVTKFTQPSGFDGVNYYAGI